MNISLPAELKAYVDEHVEEDGYASSSEYIRELIRNDRRRAQFRRLLPDGGKSELDGLEFLSPAEWIGQHAAQGNGDEE